MQKTKVVCLIMVLVLASAGTAGVVLGFGGDSAAPIMPDNAVNAVMDKPTEGTPIDRTAIENLYIAQGELQRKEGFVGKTYGHTTSAGIQQEVINNRVVKNGNVFKEMITVGVVKNAYQLFIYDDNYLYRKSDNVVSGSNVKWANTASKYNKEDFLQKFGHRSDALTGYILNDETIVSGVLEKEANGLYQYRYVLDNVKATARMLLEMKTNSNMNGYSTFEKAEIIVVMDADWQVKTVSTDCKYKVPMFGGLDCVEDITETFSDLEDGQELPEKSFFENYFDAETEKPVDQEPDALNILMDMFAPYIGEGKQLNASIVAKNDGQTVLNGLVSAKIDIENIQNIEVAAKLGEDLYLEYQQGNLYVTYQDFKASTTVDGIMGVVNALAPQLGAADQADDEESADTDILKKFTYSVKDGVCTVSLPLDVGNDKIELNIYANVTDDGYQFTNANVTFGSLTVDITLADGFTAPEHSGEYPEILGLLDLVKNGVIYGNINAFDIDVDVIFDLATTSLYANSADLGLSVIYKNDTIYAEYGAIMAKLNASDIESIITLLRLANVIEGDMNVELPQISVEQIVSLLANIKATATDNGVKFHLSMDGLSADLYLVSTQSGWNVDKITVIFGENTITLAVTEPIGQIPEVDDSQYVDVMSLINKFLNPVASLVSANSYGADFDFDVAIDGITYNVVGSFAYDVNKNISVNATVANGTATLIKANVTKAYGIVYLDVNGIKAAFEVGQQSADIDLSQIVNDIYGVNDNVDGIINTIYGIVDSVKNIDLASIDFASLIKQLSFTDGVLALTVDASFAGLGEIDVQLSVNKYKDLVVGLDGLTIGNVELSAQAAITANIGKIKVPNASDYVLNLAGKVEDIEFAVSADLLNMDISANVNMLGQSIRVRLLDGKVYAVVGEVAVVGSIDEIGALVDEVMSAIGADNSTLDLGSLANIDLSLKTILDAISIDASGSALSLGLNIDGLANVTIDFDSNANLVGISANAMGYVVEVAPTDTRVPQLDVSNVYIPVELLAEQLVAIYNNYKNILESGITADVNANITIDGVQYNLIANVNYNNGLHLIAKIADNANALVNVDMYLVNNTVYIDINGVRVATELPAADNSNANVDLVTILAALSQAKGYNDVLDSIISAVEQLPEAIQNIDYVALISSLTYANGELSASINGEMLGLSNFDVTLVGTDSVTLTVCGLAIGDVTINNLSVNAQPQCAEVTAPTSEYVTELELEVMGYKVTAKLDLYNKTAVAKTTLLGYELGLYYADNTVYVSYGAVKAKFDIADINELIAVIATFIDGEMPSLEMPELDVKQILDSLSKVVTDNGFELNASIAGVNVTLNFDANATLTNANVSVNDIDIKAAVIHGASYPSFDLSASYVDLIALISNFAGEVNNLINAEGYDITLNGNFAFENNVYAVTANLIYNNGLYVNANVTYNSANMLNVELWLVDSTLYVSADDLKLAIAMPQTAAQNGGSNKIDLTAYMGYNPYVDGVLQVVQGVIDSLMSGNVDYVALIGGLNYENGSLTIDVNPEQLGLEQFNVAVNANGGICANVSNLVLDKLTVNFNATVRASATAVAAPTGDFTTNLSIKIDDKNTIYANLDLINGVYNFRLDDMYVMYADSIIKIYKQNANGNDIYVSGNINQILDYVKQIDDLVNEFSGATESTMANINFDMFKNVDVKAIVSSLTINSDGEKVTIGANAFGFDISAIFAQGKLHTAIVPIELIDKTLQVEPCKAQAFDKFDGDHDYIQIEQVFNDYFPAFKRLVHTNSWYFSFDGDAMLTIGSDAYKVAAGSYFEFYYKNTDGMDTFKLRAKLDVHKQRADGSWQPFMDIDIVYKDGNIYVTDRGRLISGANDENRSVLRLTVSVDTLIKCYDLYDEIVAVVPQIGELVDSMMAAMNEAEENAESISYSTILTDVSYVNGLFGLTLNGSSLLSKLGAIALSAQTYGEGLSLNSLDLAYDTVSLHVENLRVYASEVVEKDGATEYAAVNDINAYEFENYHIDFNSLYELLSSFVITATPLEENNGARSFFLTGELTAKLKFGFDLADITMQLAVKVDIDKNNNVYITAKLTRSNDKIIGIVSAYDDKGGDSYLYFDGINGTFTVARNEVQEFCTKSQSYDCSKWHIHSNEIRHDTDRYGTPAYFVENISSADFAANMMDYIFEMINLNSSKQLLLGNNSLEGLVKDNIANSNSSNDFGIEDIFADYSYSETDSKYNVSLNLQAIDKNMKSAELNIYHDDLYKLSSLTGNLSLLDDKCNIGINMGLQSSTCGDATNLVQNVIFW